MPREAEPSINEREFILEALQQDIRLDGRALDAYRDLSISFGEGYGVADVRLGKTRVLTKISATITAPYPDRKFDGIFTLTTELSPLASPAFELGRQSDLETHLTLTLDTLLRRSNALPTESLCLIAGQRVWNLRATLSPLVSSGSLLTCASISLLAALLHYRIPSTEVRGGELTVFNTLDRDPVPLALLHHPLCISLAFFHGGEKVLLDPTLQEEQVSEGEMTVGANREEEVVLVDKGGGVDVDAIILLGWVSLGVRKVRKLTDAVVRALEIDAKMRDKGGISKELQAENER
ncbi:MAG: hypothetical protein Q9217_000883 [Psora testacea]